MASEGEMERQQEKERRCLAEDKGFGKHRAARLQRGPQLRCHSHPGPTNYLHHHHLRAPTFLSSAIVCCHIDVPQMSDQVEVSVWDNKGFKLSKSLATCMVDAAALFQAFESRPFLTHLRSPCVSMHIHAHTGTHRHMYTQTGKIHIGTKAHRSADAQAHRPENTSPQTRRHTGQQACK